LEESVKAGKKKAGEGHEQIVAKELVKFGATKILDSYTNTEMFACVKRVMDDFTDNVD
jgi:hypothetical protein